jgi:hypothetical protein
MRPTLILGLTSVDEPKPYWVWVTAAVPRPDSTKCPYARKRHIGTLETYRSLVVEVVSRADQRSLACCKNILYESICMCLFVHFMNE